MPTRTDLSGLAPRRRLPRGRVGALTLALAAVWFVCHAASPVLAAGPSTAAGPSAAVDEVRHWVRLLDSDRFSERQQATRQLAQLGRQAVQPLAETVSQGGRESAQRALGVLRELALAQAPDDESGAWEVLRRLATNQPDAAVTATANADSRTGSASGFGHRGAQAVLEQLRRDRLLQAHAELMASGVQIGMREYVIDSRAYTGEVISIDRQWSGDLKALRWLRWVQGIDRVLLEGPAVRQEVLQQVATMSSLRTLVMWDATIRDDIFTPLAELERIDQLEIRYIPLGLDDAQRLAQLPVRTTLGLMGTGLPIEGAVLLRDALPGIQLAYKQGGFLGVTCGDLTGQCQIASVKPGGAADLAGLSPGDVVVEIDGNPIARFEDLQLQVGSHFAGEEIEIVYERLGDLRTTKARLGKLDGE